MRNLVPLLFGLVMNAVAAARVRRQAEALLVAPYKPLPDLIHRYVVRVPELLPDGCLLVCLGACVTWRESLLNVEAHLLCLGLCTILRSGAVFLTLMPTCVQEPVERPGLYRRMFVSTHDLMFSGHSLCFIAAGHMLGSVWIGVCGPLLLVAARQHYTIDVCVSWLVYSVVTAELARLKLVPAPG